MHLHGLVLFSLVLLWAGPVYAVACGGPGEFCCSASGVPPRCNFGNQCIGNICLKTTIQPWEDKCGLAGLPYCVGVADGRPYCVGASVPTRAGVCMACGDLEYPCCQNTSYPCDYGACVSGVCRDPLGRTWNIVEGAGNATRLQRIGTGNQFEGNFSNVGRGIVTITVQGNRVRLQRVQDRMPNDPNLWSQRQCIYEGTFSPDFTTASGVMDCNFFDYFHISHNLPWRATIVR